MHFKNAIFYRLSKPFTPEFNQLGALMADHAFTPCSGQQLSSYGWISPHPAHSFMVFESNGSLLITAQRESKLLPASSINRLLTERVAKIKSTEDRTVGRKEKMQLKDEIVIDLLPRALSKFDTTQALIIPNENLIIVDASGFTAAEELLSLLRQTVGSLSIVSPEVINSTSTVMGSWLIADQSES
uniref:recombination-associated protein RdgC n=1 Tax=Neptunomonas phycophila TaxID=1572645 RepID=UPI003517552A